MITASEAAAAGAKWLDELVEYGVLAPEWWQRIDTQALNMNSVKDCVLGQLFSGEALESAWYFGYDYAVYELIGDASEGEFMIPRGFIPQDDGLLSIYNLRNEWTLIIDERRQGCVLCRDIGHAFDVPCRP